MILRLALRSLLTHPIRTLVLACGFGLGVGVMAMLLGVGEVILDQARSPAVSGGGDVVIASPHRRAAICPLDPVERPACRRLREPDCGGLPFTPRDAVSGENVSGFPVRRSAAKGGVLPSASAPGRDSDSRTRHRRSRDFFGQLVDWMPFRMSRGPLRIEERPWPRSIDFIPFRTFLRLGRVVGRMAVFQRARGDNRFYLTFLVGPKRAGGKRIAGVRLQLDRAGQRSSYSHRQEVNEADVLSSAPNPTIGSNRVRLDGMKYRIALTFRRTHRPR